MIAKSCSGQLSMNNTLEGKNDGCFLCHLTRRHPVLPSPATLLSPCTPPNPTACGMFGFIPHIPFMKRVYNEKIAAVHWSAATTKNTVVNGSSNDNFDLLPVCTRFCLFVLLQKCLIVILLFFSWRVFKEFRFLGT